MRPTDGSADFEMLSACFLNRFKLEVDKTEIVNNCWSICLFKYYAEYTNLLNLTL